MMAEDWARDAGKSVAPHLIEAERQQGRAAAVDRPGCTVAEALAGYRFHITSERELCDALEYVLGQERIEFLREAPLGEDRIDFLVGDIGVEVKVDGSDTAVAAQLLRYAPHVGALILVTTQRRHQGRTSIGGVPVTVVYVGEVGGEL